MRLLPQLRKLTGLVAGVALVGLFAAGTAVADPSGVDLQVSGAFDKPAYDTTDTVHVDVTVHNAGSSSASGVVGVPDFVLGELMLDNDSYNLLATPVALEPGADQVYHLTGTIGQLSSDHQVLFDATFADQAAQDDNPSDNGVMLSAPVTQVFSSVSGHVYVDHNGNNAFDTGEGLADVDVRLADYNTLAQSVFHTDATGSYHFDTVPSGRYYLTFRSVQGWVIPSNAPDLLITVGRDPVVTDVAATRPLSDVLHASIAFQQDSYQPGDLARFTVTLCNSGRDPITGIVSLGGGAGNPDQIVPDSWGALDASGPGVTLQPGETFRAQFTATVPAGAQSVGFVSAQSLFGPADAAYAGAPYGYGTAKVPGLTGHADVRVFYDHNGNDVGDDDEGVANTRVSLIDASTGQTVVRVVTDATGRFSVAGIPAGRYRLHIKGGWVPDPLLDYSIADAQVIVVKATGFAQYDYFVLPR